MMQMDIKVDGLAGLRQRMAAGAKTLDAELRPALRQGGEIFRTEAKHLAIGNKLPNSVESRVLTGGLSVIVGSQAKTALSIERGRQKGETPPVELITAWMNRRGVVSTGAAQAGAVQSIKTHKVSTRGRKSARAKTIMRAQRDLAWKIAMAIREHGTKALPFIIPAASHKKDEVERVINQAIGRALHRIAKG